MELLPPHEPRSSIAETAMRGAEEGWDFVGTLWTSIRVVSADRHAAATTPMNISGRNLAIIASGILLLATAVVRLAVPDRSRLRALSVEAVEIESEQVAALATVERTAAWTLPDDVYVVGWGPRVHARGSGGP